MSYHLAARDPLLDVPDEEERRDSAFRSVIGRSPQLAEAVRVARRVAGRRGSTVLVGGETGTGKELFARGIHLAGPTADAPFVPVNCSAIPGALLESELFGHERGAFTDAKQKKQGLLELARSGTLFLDEVSELPQDLQPKLLRVLEERRVRRIGGFEEIEVRCRVVAATNEPLEEAVAEGRFREDLYYRLNVLRVSIPPLRERVGDVSLLARHFLAEIAEDQGLSPVRLDPDALRVLEAHPWPGNVRELKNVLDRAALLCEGGVIRPEHLTISERRSFRPGLEDEGVHGSVTIPAEGRSLASVEAEVVRITLEITGWNKSAAARILEISRPTLARKIELYGLEPSEGPGSPA